MNDSIKAIENEIHLLENELSSNNNILIMQIFMSSHLSAMIEVMGIKSDVSAATVLTIYEYQLMSKIEAELLKVTEKTGRDELYRTFMKVFGSRFETEHYKMLEKMDGQ